jgi:hypothetical protein
MTSGAAGRALPTVTGFAVVQAVAMLRKHNIAVAPLLRAAGLSEPDFGRAAGDQSMTSHRVSAQAQAKFLGYAAEAMDDSAFGLHLAEQADPRDVGILFYVASGAQTIIEALTLLARYFRIVNEAVRVHGEATASDSDDLGMEAPTPPATQRKRRSQQRRRDSAFGDQPRLRRDCYRPFDLGWRYASPSFVRRSDALLAASAESCIVKLSAEGRKRLEALIHAGKSSAQMLTRAHPAQGRPFGGGQRLERQHNLGGGGHQRRQYCSLASATGCGGVRGDAEPQVQPQLCPAADLRRSAEAKLIALACSPAPEGFARWTLRLLEEKVVELNIVEKATKSRWPRAFALRTQKPLSAL